MKLTKESIKPIIKYLKPYKKAIYITSVFVIFENIFSLIAPILYGKIIDIVIKEKTFNRTIIILLIVWIIIDFSKEWILRTKSKRASHIAFQASQNLVTNSIKHLISLPLSFHKSKKIGEIIQRFSRADQYLYRFTEDGLFDIMPNIISSFLAFLIIAWINWLLAIIYTFFVILYIIVVIKKTNPIVKYQKKINEAFEKAYGDIFDRTPNALVIKSNSAEELENQRNLENFSKGFAFFKKEVAMWINAQLWKNWIFSTGFLILFVLSTYFIGQNKITVGQFIMLLAYVNMFSFSVHALGFYYKQLQEGIVTINRADKIFAEIPEKYDDPKSIEIKNTKGEIEFQNISFSYDKQEILKDISFKAQPGKMIAIIGKSGEGKSTLVDLISRYNIPQKGKITLDGININKIKLKSLRNQIAIVPQETALFNDSIKNNIGYSKLNATNEEIKSASILANCKEFIEKFPNKYNQLVGERGVKLSVGQKQRVAIARAVLRDPKILILDEATSALDSESERYVQEALEKVMKGRTTFVIAHRLSTIKKADLILVLENGRIIESGDHQELINHGGVYQKLSELQQVSI